MEQVAFNEWERNVRLSNGSIELIVTQEVGPRILRLGFVGERNLFAEIAGQQGGRGEPDWKIRGGHRLWIAPEESPKSYELDNVPVRIDAISGGLRATQAPGPITHVTKVMEIGLEPSANRVEVVHRLVNDGKAPITLAPWALSVMNVGGMAVIPLPAKIPHTERLTHNQQWSIWGYTDFSDPRWTLGSRYVLFRQDRTRGPNKLGIAHREGWVAYLLGEFLFVKRFDHQEGAAYPDDGMSFETFSNEEFLELESLGPLVTLQPGQIACHQETWELHRGLPACRTEADIDAHVRPLIG